MNDVCLGESRLDVAHAAVKFEEDVLLWMLNPCVGTLVANVVNDRRSVLHGFFGIKDGRQELVFDLQSSASFLGRSFALGDHCGHALADIASDIIEEVHVIRVSVVIVVGRRGVEATQGVLPR